MELLERLPVPAHWSRRNETYEVHEEEISTYSLEFLTIYLTLLGNSSMTLDRITRVQNPYLYNRYLIRKEEYVARNIPFVEKTLLHATSALKVQSIITDNLDWRLVRRSKFGKGVSFSPSPAYANTQCSRSNGRQRAMIFTKVLVGKTEQGRQNKKLPTKKYDTTIGNNKQVYVKYYDDEFYPEYVAYYHL